MNEEPVALVIGGTGMLRPAVRTLLDRGRDVAVIARRPDRGAPATATDGRFLPVPGNWSEPSSLADDVLAATGGRRATTVIAWVHTPHRRAVMEGLEDAIAVEADVIHLWGSASLDPRGTIEEIDPGKGRRALHVLLGYQRDAPGARWLTSEEVSAAAVSALDEGTSGIVAGQLDPWDGRP